MDSLDTSDASPTGLDDAARNRLLKSLRASSPGLLSRHSSMRTGLTGLIRRRAAILLEAEADDLERRALHIRAFIARVRETTT